MEITFKNQKLKRLFDSEKELRKTYGENCARKIKRRLDDLNAADCLEVLRPLPGRCHELKGNRKGQFTLDVEQPLRLVFIPVNENSKNKDDGGLDWGSINAIQITGVEDTHE